MKLGAFDGTPLGKVEGSILGSAEGPADGSQDGAGVGSMIKFDGRSEGLKVGAPVSKVTGEMVGCEFVGDKVNGLIREDRRDDPLLLDVAPLPFFLILFFPRAGEIEGASSLNENLLESFPFSLLEALDDGGECSFVGTGVAVGCALSSSLLLLERSFFLNFFLFPKIETFVESAVSFSLSISHTL